MFEEEGLVASGYFEGDKLARHSQLESSAVNFMALRGKYTVSSEVIDRLASTTELANFTAKGFE